MAGVLALSFAFSLGAAINPHYIVDVWDADSGSGLPQNSVITMARTRDGYLWVGTLNGLARFDGVRFTPFDESNAPGLNSIRIVKLFEDSRSNLWIGTDSGGIYRVKDGVAHAINIGTGTRESSLRSICEDSTGAVWLYTADGFLGRFQESTNAQAQPEVWFVKSPPGDQCRAMIVDRDGALWVGTDTNLLSLRPDAKTAPGELPPPAYPKQSISPFARLDYLLAAPAGGYWRLGEGRIEKWKGDHLQLDLGPYPWNWPTPVRAACEDAQGNLVVGTGGEGIFWFDSRSPGKYVRLTSGNTRLSHNTILSLCLDAEGDLWVGTDGGGLNRVKPQVFDTLDQSRGKTVDSACAEESGGVWAGFFGDGAKHLDNGVPENFGPPQGLLDPYVLSVFADREGQVWAGTARGGLFQFTGGNFRPASGWPMPVEKISVLFQDHQNRLWAGTQSGLFVRDAAGWNLGANALLGAQIRAIAEDRDSNLWVGTEGAGLFRLASGQAAHFGRTNGLPSNNIYCLYADADNMLWAGTSSGLARFRNGQWVSLAGRLGEARGSIGYLLEDGQGFLWMGSNAGLLRAHKQALNDLADNRTDSILIRAYGTPDGLPTGECSEGSQPAACRTKDGRLWFPMIKGLVSVDPRLLVENTHPPPVAIESVLVDGRLQGTNTLRAPEIRQVVLPAGSETLEINYAGLNLAAPDKGSFRYILSGHETRWSLVNAQTRSVRYPKLPPGHYTFEVTACNEDGIWNPVPTSLAVTVLPAFWQTRWFLAAVALGLLGMVAGSVHYVSTQRLQRQLALLRQQEALEKERARIARDLHDQLGANLTQVALLGEMAESDKELPAEVESHARQISQTARDTTHALDEIVWTVNPSNDTLDGLINYVCKYAQEYLAMAGLRYRLEVPPQLPNTPISPELRHNVFLAAKEAVNNVVKHAQAKSAWLRLRLAPDRFTLEIEDDGRGLPNGADLKGRNGLRNMRKRLEDIGGSFEAGPGAGGGTRVQLSAPLPRQA